MKLTFEGWHRDHGVKIMCSHSLSKSDLRKIGDSHKKSEVTFREEPAILSHADGVVINFHTDMRLGGEQLGSVHLSTKDLILLLKHCSEDLSLHGFVKQFKS